MQMEMQSTALGPHLQYLVILRCVSRRELKQHLSADGQMVIWGSEYHYTYYTTNCNDIYHDYGTEFLTFSIMMENL